MSFIPAQLHRYFWDVNPHTLTKAESDQILGRLLEYGDEHAIHWCKKTFTEGEIKTAVKTSRTLSQKSANFWSVIFDIPKRDILCLQRSFQNTHRKLLKY